MRKADVVVGGRYVYGGCNAPGSIVTVVGAPRIQAPHGWVVNGITKNTGEAIGAYPTRHLTPDADPVVMTCPENHPATSLYATKMADPTGVAVYGTHFGCETCDSVTARPSQQSPEATPGTAPTTT